MGRGRLRFLQACDLCLDTPLRGVDPGAIPPQPSADVNIKVLANARYRAAERIVRLAIDEAVDFVLLLGDALGNHCPGGRSPWFLAEQLRILDRRGIAVVWGAFSPVRLPGGLTFPGRVQRLDGAAGGREKYLRLPRGTVRLVNGPDPTAAMAADLTIAIRTETVPAADAVHSPRRVDYIAMAGPQRCVTNRSACSGPSQGRDYSQPGPQGCLLVDWHETACETTFHATDCVRWERVALAVNAGTTWDSLLEAMLRRVYELGRADGIDLTLVRWELTGHGPLWERLVDPRENRRLLDATRQTAQRLNRAVGIEDVRLLPDESQLQSWRNTDAAAWALGALEALETAVRSGAPLPWAGIPDAGPPGARSCDALTFLERLKPAIACRAMHELSPVRLGERAA